MMTEKGLYRSSKDKILGGVCSGMAEALNIEAWIVRLVFILSAIFYGGGVFIYLILWIVLPLHRDDFFTNKFETMNKEQKEKMFSDAKFQKHYMKKHDNQGSYTAGIILITLGILFLIDRFLPRVSFGDLWPVLLIVIGIWLLKKHSTNKKLHDEMNEDFNLEDDEL